MMKADLIIFDLDGTLVNSIPDLTVSLNQVSYLNKHKVFTQKEVESIVGGGVSKLVEDAFGIKQNEKGFQQLFSQFISHYGKNHSRHTHLFDDVVEVLEYYKLKKLAILSNKFDAFTNQIVKDFGIGKYFDMVLGATNGIAKKPSAEPINHILKKLGISPNKAVMIGDGEADIQSAQNAGIVSVSVTYGNRSREYLELLEPDFIIDELTELKTIIE